jgi:hypothetical protein
VSFCRGDGRPLVIGHRGAAALAPENTLEALEAAIDAGADAVEFDVGTGLLLGHSDLERSERPAHLDDALAFLRETRSRRPSAGTTWRSGHSSRRPGPPRSAGSA